MNLSPSFCPWPNNYAGQASDRCKIFHAVLQPPCARFQIISMGGKVGELHHDGVQYADDFLQSATHTAAVANRMSDLSNEGLVVAFLHVSTRAHQVGAKILVREVQGTDYQGEDGALLAGSDGVEIVSGHLLSEMEVRTEEEGLWPPLGHVAVARAAELHPDMFGDPEWLAASGLDLNGINPSAVAYSVLHGRGYLAAA